MRGSIINSGFMTGLEVLFSDSDPDFCFDEIWMEGFK